MPNWCDNHLRISGPAADIKAFKKKAVGHFPWDEPAKGEEPNVLNFHSLVPIPKKVLKAGYNEAGCNWERENWGCRSGAFEASVVDEWECGVLYGFDTPWTPPLPLLAHLTQQWPTLTFVLDYEELGAGFKGIAKASNGTLEDHCVHL
jgi:hypothetical protein